MNNRYAVKTLDKFRTTKEKSMFTVRILKEDGTWVTVCKCSNRTAASVKYMLLTEINPNNQYRITNKRKIQPEYVI